MKLMQLLASSNVASIFSVCYVQVKLLFVRTYMGQTSIMRFSVHLIENEFLKGGRHLSILPETREIFEQEYPKRNKTYKVAHHHQQVTAFNQSCKRNKTKNQKQ